MFLFKGKRIFIYLWTQLFTWLFLVLAVVVFLFIFSQALRVAPVFAGAGGSFWELSSMVLGSIVPIVGWALTPAVMISIFAVVGRMHADGELLGLEAAGLTRLSLGGMLLSFALCIGVVSGLIWLWAGPSTVSGVRTRALDLAERAILGKIEAGRLYSWSEGVSFYAAQKKDGQYGQLFFERELPALGTATIFAKRATIGHEPGLQRLVLRLDEGTVIASGPGPKTAMTFQSLEVVVSIARVVNTTVGFIPERLGLSTRALRQSKDDLSVFEFWRRVTGPLNLLSLALASVLLGIGINWSRRSLAMVFAGAVFVVHHVLGRALEGWLAGEMVSPPVAAAGPAFVVTIVCMAGLALLGTKGAKVRR